MLEHNLPWWRADRPWGFRFSVFDAAVILLGVSATWLGYQYLPALGILIPFTLGHFLLFCNTFRVGGERSLLWIAVFFANFWWWTRAGDIPWLPIVLTQIPVTLVLIGHTLLSKNYHGLGCERINPEGYRAGALTEGRFTRRMLERFGLPAHWIEVLAGRKPTAESSASIEQQTPSSGEEPCEPPA